MNQFNDAGCMSDPDTGGIRVGDPAACRSLLGSASTGKNVSIVG